jgi:hypothetical protein
MGVGVDDARDEPSAVGIDDPVLAFFKPSTSASVPTE